MVTVCCGAAEKVFKIMNKFLITESTLPQCSLQGGVVILFKNVKAGKGYKRSLQTIKSAVLWGKKDVEVSAHHTRWRWRRWLWAGANRTHELGRVTTGPGILSPTHSPLS